MIKIFDKFDLFYPFEKLLFFAFCLITPSDIYRNNFLKIFVLSSLFSVCFLFFSGYVLPGGAIHYTDWALALDSGGQLPLGHAQRQVTMGLIYWLTGFAEHRSYIGITLVYFLFGLVTPLVVYACMARMSLSVAFYISLGLILSLAPFTYVKFFYPDQIYMFVLLMGVASLIGYIWTAETRYIYMFTIAFIVLALTRTSGMFLLPLVFLCGYLAHRIHVAHLLVCALLIVSAFAINKHHRTEVFNLEVEQEVSPTGKGMQIFYATYMWMKDFNYPLSEDLGPNTKLLFDNMRKNLQSSPLDSDLLKANLSDSPNDFWITNFGDLSTEQLIEKVKTEPNEEFYYALMLPLQRDGSWHPSKLDDDWMFEIAKEIWLGYPMFIVKYGLRNLAIMFFDPGWVNPRYSTVGLSRQGLQFVPGEHAWSTHSTDAVFVNELYGERAARELEFHQLKSFPDFVAVGFNQVGELHRKTFRQYVYATSVVMFVGWVILLSFLYRYFTGRLSSGVFSRDVAQKSCWALTAITLVMLYENTIIALFVQPHFRYFHMSEPVRWLVIGFSSYLILQLPPVILTLKRIRSFIRGLFRLKSLSNISRYSRENHLQMDGLIARNSQILFGLVVGAVFSLVFLWADSQVNRTTGSPPISIISAVVESLSTGDELQEITQTLKKQDCIYHTCDYDLQEAVSTPINFEDVQVAVNYQCRGEDTSRFQIHFLSKTSSTIGLDCY